MVNKKRLNAAKVELWTGVVPATLVIARLHVREACCKEDLTLLTGAYSLSQTHTHVMQIIPYISATSSQQCSKHDCRVKCIYSILEDLVQVWWIGNSDSFTHTNSTFQKKYYQFFSFPAFQLTLMQLRSHIVTVCFLTELSRRKKTNSL